jgi:hypothetical protein
MYREFKMIDYKIHITHPSKTGVHIAQVAMESFAHDKTRNTECLQYIARDYCIKISPELEVIREPDCNILC